MAMVDSSLTLGDEHRGVGAAVGLRLGASVGTGGGAALGTLEGRDDG